MAVEEEIKKTEQKLEQEAKKHWFMFFWDPVIIYFIIIIIISNWPSTPTPEQAVLGFIVSDKIKHVILYFGFSMLLGVACRHSKFPVLRENHYFIALVASSVIGILDEVNQLRVPGRHMGVDEMMLNIIGGMLAQSARALLRLEKKLLIKIF